MNQAQLQEAADRAREEDEKGGGAVGGILVWFFVLYALYGYFSG